MGGRGGRWGAESWAGGLALAFVMGASVACSGDSSRAAEMPTPSDSSPEAEADSLYDPAHVLEVAIELDPEDWTALRGEGRSLIDIFSGVTDDFEFTEFPATASVDGQRFEAVAVRKKGFLGSLSRLRPSLKLDFGSPAANGPRRLTLNNNRQDPSHARQCLAYGLFQGAGLPAPRCNLAQVSVNGEDLGTYSNVEPIKKPFLERAFGDDSGNLYEGQGVDFVTGEVDRLQLKTNETQNDRSDVARLASALEASDEELTARLTEVLDIEQFRSFWAVETLAGHWDGYAGNQNNYYVYADPGSGLFQFIPWGTDGAFAQTNIADPLNTTRTVYASSRIARRLYELPEERQKFRQRLAELAGELWDSAALAGELERWTERAGDALPRATADLRQHLQSHGELVLEELQGPAPEWIDSSAQPSACAGSVSDFSLEFSTTFGDLSGLDPSAGGFDVSLSLDGAPFEGFWFGRAGLDPMAQEPSIALRALSFMETGTGVLLQLSLPPAEFQPGRWPLHGAESVGVIVILDGAAARFVGFVSDGVLELAQARATDGAPVSGRLQARVLQLSCADL